MEQGSVISTESKAHLLRSGERKEAGSPKIGVFIVAYNHEKTITKVLDRITDSIWNRITQVFIFDDSSKDETSKLAAEYKQNRYADKIKVFYNQVNLGYGGNQKRGYLYAIQNGFDIVVLLHGDGQYAPECLDLLIDPIARGEAEAVFGSRMMIKGGALKGGMPFYKYLGNRVLTTFQNWALGYTLTEYHSGYRAYHMPSISKLPFTRNSNDFHFDNEIILQHFEAGYRIAEVPIPTYYGDEICYVNGMKYAWDVFKTTLKYRLHKVGMAFYAPQFDLKSGHKYTLKKNAYSSHSRVVSMIKRAGSIEELDAMDVGCGSGYLAAHIAKLGYRVIGVDVYDNDDAKKNCAEFHVCNIENEFGVDAKRKFDVIVFADVLEHVRNPEQVLLRARKHLKPKGRIIASTGNVAHLYVRMSLLLGSFNYTERGILDRTHTRLFTRQTFRELFSDCSFKVVDEKCCPIPFENIFSGWPLFSNFLCSLNMLGVWLLPSLFAYQMVFEVRAKRRFPSDLLRQEQIDAPYNEWEFDHIETNQEGAS